MSNLLPPADEVFFIESRGHSTLLYMRAPNSGKPKIIGRPIATAEVAKKLSLTLYTFDAGQTMKSGEKEPPFQFAINLNLIKRVSRAEISETGTPIFNLSDLLEWNCTVTYLKIQAPTRSFVIFKNNNKAVAPSLILALPIEETILPFKVTPVHSHRTGEEPARPDQSFPSSYSQYHH